MKREGQPAKPPPPDTPAPPLHRKTHKEPRRGSGLRPAPGTQGGSLTARQKPRDYTLLPGTAFSIGSVGVRVPQLWAAKKKLEKDLLVACTLSQVSSSVGEVGGKDSGDARKEALVQNRKRAKKKWIWPEGENFHANRSSWSCNRGRMRGLMYMFIGLKH